MKKPVVSQKFTILTLISLGATFLAPFQLAQASYSAMLQPTAYTPSSYIPPQYDAFDSDYYRKPPAAEPTPDTAPTVEMSISTNQNGLQSQARGTTSTRFTFSANNSTDNETTTNKLEARWDFESDGKLDSYFSRTKTIQHTYAKAGVYTVKLEVLDTEGNIASTTRAVTIANNTPPTPSMAVSPLSGTENTVFHFDTSRSRDDQYLAFALEYRFDWNSDGKWDTKYERKTSWNHRFQDASVHVVKMEVQDPEGATASTTQVIRTNANTAPTALFTMKNIANSLGAGFLFDASRSTDAESEHRNLLYRWDFNYNGPNDIIFDTNWSSSDKYSGYYGVGGDKVIKLEVKDENGEISATYAQINVPASEAMVKRYVGGLK